MASIQERRINITASEYQHKILEAMRESMDVKKGFIVKLAVQKFINSLSAEEINKYLAWPAYKEKLKSQEK